MLKKNVPASTPAPAAIAPATVIKTTPARNSPIPKAVAPMATPSRKEIGHELIAKRAYEIFLSGKGGDQTHNWLMAERELRAL